MNTTNRNARREFLRKLIAGTSLISMAPYINAMDAFGKPFPKGVLPKRPLGKTGYNVGIYSLGAQATVEQYGRQDEAVAIINRAIDLGINYIDTAAAYGQDNTGEKKQRRMGTSEQHVGEVMKTRRNEVFLASKTHDRTYDGSMRLLEQSLKNLQTDHLDLWQIHNVKTKDREDISNILKDDGATKALEKARSEGIVKFVGVTGHMDPAPLKFIIERYPFDNLLVALNAADKHHNSFIDELLPMVVEKEMGIVGMKIPARDRIFSKGGIITMKEAMSYSLSLPISTIIIGLDKIAELEENIKIAQEFEQLTADEMLTIEDKVKPHYEHLMFYKGLSNWPPIWSGNDV
jgi:aryl-alcohol dehydrogenase-like predicted oxidoreductase